MNIPKVTVILTSFNHAKYIGEAIESVLAQTFTDFELIIWDDASEDNSWEIINRYSDSRILKFRNETTMRGIFNINKAISEVAKGRYIAIHHSDDIWVPEKLEKQLGFLKNNPKYGAVFTKVMAISDSGEVVDDPDNYYASIFDQDNRSRHEWLNHFFTKGNVLCHPSVLIDKKCYEACGLYRYGLAQMGDFDMWVRLCLKYEIYIIPEQLTKFRARSANVNTSGNTIALRSRVHFEYYLVLKEVIKISFAELLLVFPQAIKYEIDDEVPVEFVWAMMLIDETHFALAKIIALEMLFNMLNDASISKVLAENYGFTSIDYVGLTEKYGIANKSVIEYEMELTSRDEKIRVCNEAIDNCNALRETLSWKITKPLRYLSRKIQKMKTIVKR